MFGAGIAIPRAGVYVIRHGAFLQRGTPAEWLNVFLDASDGSVAAGIIEWTRSAAGSAEQGMSFAASGLITIAAAGTWRLRVYNSNGTSIVSAQFGFMEAIPARVA
jgi:hypothetical protein